MSASRVIILGPGGVPANVDDGNNLQVIAHSHLDSTQVHFHIDGLTSVGSPHAFIIIDQSDLVNYKHLNTGYIHVEWVEIGVDADTNGDYVLAFGYLDNVDDTNGDLVVVKHFSGTKQTGNVFDMFINPAPNGWRLCNECVTSHQKIADSVLFQTDVELRSTLSPEFPDTFSGDGDMVLYVTVNGGTINVTFDVGYHTHETIGLGGG